MSSWTDPIARRGRKWVAELTRLRDEVVEPGEDAESKLLVWDDGGVHDVDDEGRAVEARRLLLERRHNAVNACIAGKQERK